MFITAKRNIILPSVDGSENYRVQRGFIGEIPDWATKTQYFQDLVKDGKIGIPASRKDKDISDVEEKPVRRRKPEEK